MKKKILIIISSVLAVSILCFIIIFVISVNQSKNIVRLINEQNYAGLEDACETALFIDKIKSLGVYAIHPDIKVVSEELIKEVHENNLKVNIFTVNNPMHMRLLIKNKVDGAFTDYPELLNEIIKENN